MPRTCVANSSESRCGMPLSASAPDGTLILARLLRRLIQGRDVGRQGLELRRGQARVGRHDDRPDLERARDRVAWQTRPDVHQLRSGAVVAVLAQLVAGEAAGL